jgi:galactose mutarotase-like enzyme
MLRDAEGRELLWNADPAFLTGRALLLFHIVGTLNGGQFGWRGKRYALPCHGFTRNLPFEVLRNEERNLLFHLRNTADTLLVYPFHFELDVAFHLLGQALEI